MTFCRALSSVLMSVACVLPAVAASTSFAQNSGTIEGHVYGADTNAPLRVGNVMLEVAPAGKASVGGAINRGDTATAATAGLHLDGSFAFPHVRPGRYYLYASAPGYLSPFDPTEPPGQSAGRPTDAHPGTDAHPILVELGPNQTVRVNFELQRGAAVEGQILFDDGSPVASVMVKALKKGADGKWKTLQTGMLSLTDDRGHYRIAGLAAGEYLIEADMSIAPDLVMDKNVIKESRFAVTTRAVYSGSVFDEKNATSFKLTSGEERTGEDLTFRASALHTVSGVVVAQSDGHPIPDAGVAIDSADGEVVEAVHGLDANGAFQFEYVPEGHYTLKVSGARDVNAQGRTEREYGPAQQPLDVENDTTGLVMVVPARR